MINSKDLSKEPPTSPRVRVRDYAILARMADKGRASLNGTLGEFHFNCPLDNMLFGFKAVEADDVLEELKKGATDEEIGLWIDKNGIPKTPEEIVAWSDEVEKLSFYDIPEKRDWFVSECEKVGIDPTQSTLFDYLEADDRVSFKQ